MKILFTGGGSGGHFYPIIAVAEKLREIVDAEKLVDVKMYYMSNSPYNQLVLDEVGLQYVEVPAGKMRIYFSIQNFFDMFKTISGVLIALWKMFLIYPDVVFSKGCYASFPALMAARILRIPVVIHESDSAPGRVTKWSAKFAERIAISYPDVAEILDPSGTRVAWTGQPMRSTITKPTLNGAREYLGLEAHTPVIFITGGSQGATIINDCVVQALPELVKKYQIVHQVGVKNFDEVKGTSGVVLKDSEHKNRYKPIAYLEVLGMKMAAGAANIVVSRAGSTIFEIATWGLPSVIIPISVSNGDHQRKNAYNYARAGACIVLEENNLHPVELIHAIDEIIEDKNKYDAMAASASKFAKTDAASIIARAVYEVADMHE